MTDADKHPDDQLAKAESSNGVYLTVWQWLGTGLFTIVLFMFVPSLWRFIEKFDLEPDYRIPYDLNEDYWLFERYASLAAEDQDRFDWLLIGDSVIWGQYARRAQTLSHYLNELDGETGYANLGLNGAHPTALCGLLETYGIAIRARPVLLHCNLLWMSSPRSDLQLAGQYPFNHRRLLPQFVPAIPAYKEELSPRIGIMVERPVPLDNLTRHLQQAYFERNDIPAWTLEHPYENPLSRVTRGLPPSDDLLRFGERPWTENKGIKRQEYDWVNLETSLQWRSFQRAIAILQRDNNKVFVLVGPFNEHLILEKNLPEYRRVKSGIETWLQNKRIPYLAPAALPSEEYADSSHPLAAGYASLARQLEKVLP
jgi:lysophospholipase L1-like esterase